MPLEAHVCGICKEIDDEIYFPFDCKMFLNVHRVLYIHVEFQNDSDLNKMNLLAFVLNKE